MHHLYQAFISLSRHKIRAILSSIGITIGIASVTLIMSMGESVREVVRDQFDSLGSNVVVVFPGKLTDDQGNFQDSEGGIGTIEFTPQQVDRLSDLRLARYVVPLSMQSATVQPQGNEEFTGSIVLTNPEIFPLRTLSLGGGQLFTQTTLDKKLKHVVLGAKAADELYARPQQAIGNTIRINQNPFTVIGILESKGTGGGLGPDFDSFIFMPHTSGEFLNPTGNFFTIHIQPTSTDATEQLKADAKQILIRDFDEDEFSLIEQEQIQNTFESIFTVVNAVLISIAAISLLVGGVGVMNIMYASVNERIKEIGIRRALGARKIDILLLFLSESTLLCILGAGMAILITIIVATIASRFLPVTVPIYAILIAIAVSSAIGIGFGTLPAKRAANIQPIDAIRS